MPNDKPLYNHETRMNSKNYCLSGLHNNVYSIQPVTLFIHKTEQTVEFLKKKYKKWLFLLLSVPVYTKLLNVDKEK